MLSAYLEFLLDEKLAILENRPEGEKLVFYPILAAVSGNNYELAWRRLLVARPRRRRRRRQAVPFRAGDSSGETLHSSSPVHSFRNNSMYKVR